MKDLLDDKLQAFLLDMLPERPPILAEMEIYAEQAHIPIVEPAVGQLLNLLTAVSGAGNILEIGTAIGYSAISMAQALPEDGALTTIELVAERAAQAADNFRRAGVAHKIRQIVGDARILLPQLEGSYDLIFLDAAKGQYGQFLTEAARILRPGGLLIADNVLINGWVVDLSYPNHRRKTMVYRMRAFLAAFKNSNDYQCSLLPLGDGLALIRKKEEERP